MLVGAAMPVGATTPKSLVETDKMYNKIIPHAAHPLSRQKNLFKLKNGNKKQMDENKVTN